MDMNFFRKCIVGMFLFVAIPQVVLAAGPAPTSSSSAATQDDACNGDPKTVLCDPNHPEKGQCIKLCNPLQNNETDITKILGFIIKVALGIVGSLTLFMLVWGGFLWLTAAGNEERIKKGTQTMLWAAIGVVAVFSSYFVLRNFTEYLTTGSFFVGK